MDQLGNLEGNIARQKAQDDANQSRDLDEKRKRRAALLQIKKMKIEAKQIASQTAKEVEINQNKFDKQMDAMNKHQQKQLAEQTRVILAQSGGREQALIMVNEAHDDLLAKKLKILMSKQFFDLSKYLVGLQSELAMDHMVRKREIDLKFEADKEAIIQ